MTIHSTDGLLALARAYCADAGINLGTLGQRALHNWHFFRRLEAGKGCTLAQAERAERWFRDHWPPGLPLPPDPDHEEAA